MDRRVIAVVFALALVLPLLLVLNASDDAVRIDSGRLRGAVNAGVRSYKGIPYAAPPVGDLRWKPPQPVHGWNGVRDATAIGAACPQVLRNPATLARLQLDPLEPQSEDCLFLNVWTPGKKGDRLPVMVWIHGGGFQYGSGIQYTPDGSPLARKGAVVVTFNHRLGALGFLAHRELTAESPQHSSGNYAFLDQIAALRWVQRNIEVFGGDPKRVTLFGYSAGAWSMNVLMASPLARGLFHQAIAESGARFQPQKTLSEAEQVGDVYAANVKADSLKALRALPAEKTLLTPAFPGSPTGVPAFSAEETVDGWLLPAEVRQVFDEGKQYDVPMIVGSNADEPGGAAAQAQTWARITATRGRKPVFLYYFSHVPPHPMSKEVGAYHGAEVPYVFNDLGQHRWTFSEIDRTLAETMSSYWVNFAKNTSPNGPGLPRWEPYGLTDEAYLGLGDTIAPGHHLRPRKPGAPEAGQSSESRQ